MPFMAQLLPVTAFSIDFSPLPADIPPGSETRPAGN
jgi:hypothetical protein